MKRTGFKKKTFAELKAKFLQKRSQKKPKTNFKAKTALKPKKRSTSQIGCKKGGTKTPAKLKKDLDAIFSRFIRQKYADANGMARCYTCSTLKHWTEMQNGHWISRSYLATRFSESNCRVQCVACNMYQNGRPDVFAVNLIKEGVDIVALEQTKYRVFKIDRHWYEEKIAYYKNLVE